MTPRKIWVYLAHADSPQKKSHALLEKALRVWAEETGQADADLTVVRPKYEKPYLKELPHIGFSVSRSGEYWACVISGQQVGVDLQEEVFSGTERITRRFFHPLEQAWLKERPEAFFRVWTAKESYVKFTGEGVTDAFGAFSVADSDGLLDSLGAGKFRFLDAPEGYVLCLCAGEIEEVSLTIMQ